MANSRRWLNASSNVAWLSSCWWLHRHAQDPPGNSIARKNHAMVSSVLRRTAVPDDLKPLIDNAWDKDFVAGIIDVKSTVTETADEVADRIRAVLEFVPADRLGLSTDCGLINLPRMIAAGKLRALADGAALVREELSQAQATGSL